MAELICKLPMNVNVLCACALHVCVCMHVCNAVCVYACMCACTVCVCMHVYISVCRCMCACAHLYVCVFLYMCVWGYASQIWATMQIVRDRPLNKKRALFSPQFEMAKG